MCFLYIYKFHICYEQKAKEEEKNTIFKDKEDLHGQVKTLQAKINSLEKSTKLEKTSNTGIEVSECISREILS
jgi:hypothetical protein